MFDKFLPDRELSLRTLNAAMQLLGEELIDPDVRAAAVQFWGKALSDKLLKAHFDFEKTWGKTHEHLRTKGKELDRDRGDEVLAGAQRLYLGVVKSWAPLLDEVHRRRRAPGASRAPTPAPKAGPPAPRPFRHNPRGNTSI